MVDKIASLICRTITIKKVLPIKHTARCPVQYVCDIDNEGLFLVVIAKTPIQKFYLIRSIKKQAEFYTEFKEYYEFNMPKYTGGISDLQYAIYPYFENTVYPGRFNTSPLKNIEAYYAKFCRAYEVSERIIEEIENDFLSAFPYEFHGQIKALPMYDIYFSNLRGMKNLTIGKEHGQYGYANILEYGKKQYLVDFEFSRNFQPVYFDYYDYLEHMPLIARIKYTKKETVKLAQLKINLIDKANSFVDKVDSLNSEFVFNKCSRCRKILSVFYRKTRNFLIGH
jgi:hypothetical protein